MYVEIFSKSEENESSRGRTSWLNTGSKAPSIELLTSKPPHLGNPPWHVQVKATGWRELSSGERGGEMRSNNYRLELELTPTDLTALVSFALANGLVEVIAAGQPQEHK